jgi:hypothetical protein
MNISQSIKEAKALFGDSLVTVKLDDSPHYNRRTIVYASGVVVHTYFETAMVKDTYLEKDLCGTTHHKERAKPKKRKRVKPAGDYCLEPETRKLNKRAQRAIDDYVLGGLFEYWTTLTFDPNVHAFCLDYDETVKKTTHWLKNYKQRYAPDFKYLMVFELMAPEPPTMREKWHVHLFMKGVSSRDVIRTPFKNKYGRPIYDFVPWSSKFGYTQLDAIKHLYTDDVPGLYKLAAYLSKYAVKGLESQPNKKRYRASAKLCDKPLKSYSYTTQPLESITNDTSLSYHGYYYVRNETGAITNKAHKFVEALTNETPPL